MRLVIAQSTFDHPETDDLVTPGQALVEENYLAEALTRSRHCEVPRPNFHHQVEEGPETADGEATTLFHKGGGHYLVLDQQGVVLNEDSLHGREASEDFARSYSREEETTDDAEETSE